MGLPMPPLMGNDAALDVKDAVERMGDPESRYAYLKETLIRLLEWDESQHGERSRLFFGATGACCLIADTVQGERLYTWEREQWEDEEEEEWRADFHLAMVSVDDDLIHLAVRAVDALISVHGEWCCSPDYIPQHEERLRMLKVHLRGEC